jgi:uncharacterized protein YbjT (DUF2867 family)
VILVTGATGTVGRQVVAQLGGRGLPVRRALTEERHAGRRYVLTGPEAITQAEQVGVIGEVVGRAVRWEELPPEVARRQLLAAWGDAGFVDSALATWERLTRQPETVTRTVEEVTGVAARTFRQWAGDHVGDFRTPPRPPGR